MGEQRTLAAISSYSLPRAAVVVNAGLALSLLLVWVGQAKSGDVWRGDFSSYYFGGVMIREGYGSRLYDRDLQKHYQARIVPERGETDELLGFNYPPHSALPAPLFASLPRTSAFYVWTGVQLLLLFPLFHFLHRLTQGLDRLPWAVLATGVLAFPPLFISFQLGQVSIVLLTCLLGFLCNLAEERPFQTAFWLTLATIKPQMALAPLAILLAGRRWRELGYVALLFSLWGLATTALLGVSCWTAFLNMLQHTALQFGRDGIHPQAMYNLKGFLTCALGEERANWINLLSSLSLLFAVLFILILGRKQAAFGSSQWDLRIALSLQLGLLANPHFNPCDAAAFIAPAILFYRGMRRSGESAHGVAALLLCCPILFALDCYGISTARPGSIHLFFVLMAVLAVLMAKVQVGSIRDSFTLCHGWSIRAGTS